MTMTDDEILKIADRITSPEFLKREKGFVNRARIGFAREIEALTLERAAKACEERGERNRIAAGLPNGDRDEFYCADDIRRLKPLGTTIRCT
jgi:hypothetical protein